MVWIEQETISSFLQIFELSRRCFDACYLFVTTLLIGILIHSLFFINSNYRHLFQLFSILSAQLLIYFHLQSLYNNSNVPSSALILASLILLCISFFIRYLFRLFIYSDLTAEYSSLMESYLLFWRKKICYRHKLGWNSEDSVDNSCLFFSSCRECCDADLSLWNVAEYFWDYSLLLILNTLTGLSFLITTLLLFIFSLLYSFAIHVILLLISGMFLLYLPIFPLDLFGALVNHHLSSSDLFTFHILKGLVFLLEHYLQWVYCIRYPLTSWQEYKPNYYPLHIVILFLFSHLFTGSRAFFLLDHLSYHHHSPRSHQSRNAADAPAPATSPQTYQKYLTHLDSPPLTNVSDERDDDEEQDCPFQLLLPPVCLLMMISETILYAASAILIAIAYLPSWQSCLLILLSFPTLVADLVMMVTLYRKRIQAKRIVVIDKDAELQLEDLSRIPQQDPAETDGAADCENNLTKKRENGDIEMS